jgi:hypothetical protein
VIERHLVLARLELRWVLDRALTTSRRVHRDPVLRGMHLLLESRRTGVRDTCLLPSMRVLSPRPITLAQAVIRTALTPSMRSTSLPRIIPPTPQTRDTSPPARILPTPLPPPQTDPTPLPHHHTAYTLLPHQPNRYHPPHRSLHRAQHLA